MGYQMDQQDVQFKIHGELFLQALMAVKALMMTKKRNDFAWVDTDEVMGSDTLQDTFTAWRWHVEVNDLGDIDDLYFDGENLGNDEDFFRAIAPYVEDGGYIQMVGEDHEMWRWAFKEGKLITQYPAITWEDGE